MDETFAHGKIWKRMILIGRFMVVGPHQQEQGRLQITLFRIPKDCMLT